MLQAAVKGSRGGHVKGEHGAAAAAKAICPWRLKTGGQTPVGAAARTAKASGDQRLKMKERAVANATKPRHRPLPHLRLRLQHWQPFCHREAARVVRRCRRRQKICHLGSRGTNSSSNNSNNNKRRRYLRASQKTSQKTLPRLQPRPQPGPPP